MNRWAEQGVAVLGIWALFAATGCNGFFVYPGSAGGGSGSGSNTGDYVYVANATNQTLDAFSAGTGTLTSVASYGLGFTPNAVVVNPSNTMVIVAGTNLGTGYIDTFSIGSGGALSLLNGGNNNVGLADVQAMDISPDGQWLVGADANTLGGVFLTLDEYQVSSNGQLTAPSAVPAYQFTGAGTVVPSAVKFAPNGLALYVAAGTAGDLRYTFNTASNSGLLTSNQALSLSPGNGSDNSLTVSADSAYVFIAHSNSSVGAMETFSNGLGSQTSSIAAGTQPISVVLNKAGTDAYLANQGDGTISGYSVNASGGLAALTNSPYKVSSGKVGPRALVADNSGNYILAITNSSTPYLAMYSYDSTTAGQLDLVVTGNEAAGAVALAATH